ncbi:MAG: calcium-binding protein, partial [Pseudomonadota bacterium]
ANDGQIGGSEQSPSNGRLDFSEGQDRLTNTGTIALDGIYYRGGFDELVNSGTLVADIRASNALDVTNSGTVHSDIITLGTDENDLTNSGAITAGIRISGATKVINTGSLQTPVLEDVATFRNEGDVVVDRLGLTGARQFENLENFTGQVDLGTDATRAFIRNTGDMVRGENSGLISATFAPGAGPLEIINSGEMIGDVFFEGETEGLVTFQNTGSFQGALSFSGVGLALDQSGSWLGNIQLFNATNDTVNNTGSIVGLIRLGDGFNRLINHGQIIADGLTDFPISMGSDADVVENKGTITGNIDLGEGDNSFINDGVFNGDLSAGGGNDTIMTLGTMVGDIQAGGGNNELFVMGDFNGTVLIGEGSDVINTDIADLYVVDTGLGVDIVFASVDFSLLGTSGVEHLVLEGAAVRGTGNELDNDLEGNAQDNVLIGLSGDDTLYGKAGNDSLRGGVGKDSIDGNTGDDMVKAGRGDDTVTGGDGDDVIFGHVGDDELRGNDGADTILGGSGNDNIDGGEDDDSLVGNRGDDTILAGDGDDTLKGDKGNDELIGGTGDDLLFGDLGDDTAFFNLGDGNDTFDGGVQGASVIRDFDTLVVTDTNNDVPLVVIEADGTDAMMKANGLSGSVRTLEVETFDVTLGGGDDFVIINDTTSTDLIRVELNLGNGFNQLSGSDATVSIDAVAGGGRDSLVGGSGRDTLSGGNSRDTLIGGGDHDVLIGGNGLDSLSGGSGEDTLDGGAGNDTLDGGIGADQLFGGDNNDLLRGGGDDDFLNGASGVDTLTGGSGADRFDFIDIAAVDEITDFSGSDLIGLFTVAFPALFGGLGANNFVLGTAAADSDDFIIYDQTTGRLFYDEDGSGSGFAAIHFATLTNNAVLDHTDFMILN